MMSTTVETRTAQIEVLTAGSLGPDIIFLHGLLGVERDSLFLQTLSTHARVFAPLLPGFGTSPDAPTMRTMLDATLLMLDVVTALPAQNPIFVGHCMGGMIAAEMAAIAPNDISRLALIAPLGLWLEQHQIPDVFAMTPRDIANVWYTGGAASDMLPDLDDPHYLETVLLRNARQLGTAGKLLFPIPDRGLSSRLARAKADTLLLWGAEDKYVPPVYATAFAELLQTSSTVTLPDTGHMVIDEHPQSVVDAILGHFENTTQQVPQ